MMLNVWMLLNGLALAGIAAGTPLSVTALKCEYRVNPLGIDVTQPRLSWQLTSTERGVLQQACQILVASSPEFLANDEGDLWDSGKVESGQSIQVPYAGKPLASEQRCYWKVRVWIAEDTVSPWSEPAYWTMGLLEASDWKGEWIGLDSGGETARLQYEDIRTAQWIWYPEGNPASSAPAETRWFRTTLTLPENTILAEAKAHLTADNSCELFVNGERAGSAGSYNQIADVNITQWLKSGPNTIAIAAVNAGDGPNPAGLLASFVCRFEDGQELNLRSDDNWRSGNIEQPGWKQPDFDDTAWKNVQVLGGYGMAPWGEIGQSDKTRLPARKLRREFNAERPVDRATAYICGLGHYELYLNGSKIGDDVLVPGLTEYDKRVFYLTYDVTEQIKTGVNAIGVLLGNGRYYAPRSSQPTHTKTYGYPKLMFQMHLEYADGTKKIVSSDTDWKLTANGPITTNNEYDGEEYDARKEMPGWSSPGFDDSAWEAAHKVGEPGGILAAQMAAPIRVMEILKPIAMNQPRPGMYIYDMGQNMVGWCKLTVSGPRGTAVKMRFAEVLKDDGTLYLDNIRGAEVTDIYTLKGEGVETFIPRFVFHGFRYVELTGFPGEVSLGTLEGQVIHDAVADAGHFECSNPLLNQIYSNARWGVRGNYRSMPTDCPQRDERQGWLGDRSAECKGESYLFDIAALYTKWIGDMEDGQKESGSVSDVCPTYWPLYNDNVTWPSTFIIAPSMLYTQYADTRVIERHYGGMKKWIEHMIGYIKNDLIARDNYGDWCVPPEEKHLIHSKDPKRKTPGELLASAYFIYDLNLMAGYAGMLGKQEDREDFLAQAKRMTEAFNTKFWSARKGYYGNGSETSQVLPLAFGIATPEMHKSAFDYLADKIMNVNKGHLATGLIGGQWLMRTLSDNGRPDIAYTIASRTEYPSWGYMIEKGATTVWELWNGDTADPAMNSHNHVMLVGDLIIWFHEYLAGIQSDPAAPGFKHIIMKPHLVGDLSRAAATHHSLYGEIASSWEIDNGAFDWKIQIPGNTTATVHVPVKENAEVLEGGLPAGQAPGLEFLRRDPGYAVYKTAAGTYHFSVK